MDDLNDKGVIDDPQCKKVIEQHTVQQEQLNKKFDDQRARQEEVSMTRTWVCGGFM